MAGATVVAHTGVEVSTMDFVPGGATAHLGAGVCNALTPSGAEACSAGVFTLPLPNGKEVAPNGAEVFSWDCSCNEAVAPARASNSS